MIEVSLGVLRTAPKLMLVLRELRCEGVFS
jgi:hypothetical protein